MSHAPGLTPLILLAVRLVLERLALVRRAQVLGFSLEQIARYFSLPESERRDKAVVIEAAKAKLRELDLHLAEVKAQKREILAFLAKHQAGGPGSDA